MSKKQDAFKYMKGWYCAAGIKPLDKDLEKNEHYMAGYRAGKRDRRIARKVCEKIYNIKFDIIAIAGKESEVENE